MEDMWLGYLLRSRRIVVDVTDRDSILQAKKVIEDADGVLHILVNKCISFLASLYFKADKKNQCWASRTKV